MHTELALRLTPHGCWQCQFLSHHWDEPSVERHVVPGASHPTVTSYARPGGQLLVVQQVTASFQMCDKTRTSFAVQFLLRNTWTATRVAPPLWTIALYMEAAMETMSVHQCTCPICRANQPHPDRAYHHHINVLMSRLSEPQRRWFSADEAHRIGYGGKRLLAHGSQA